MKHSILIFFLTILLSSCTTPAKIKVSKASDSDLQTTPGMYYSLPRTVFRVNVEFSRTITMRGPYALYAEEFLGIKNVPVKNDTEWKISGINAYPLEESDPGQVYFLTSTDYKTLAGVFRYTPEGFLLPDINTVLFGQGLKENGFNYENEILFTDLSAQRFHGEVTDTLYKTIFEDSVFVKIPVLRTIVEKKTEKQKAREAANFITRLRSSRLELLTEMHDILPEAFPLEVNVREIDKLEKEYLSLFTGKTFEDKYNYTFHVTPGNTGNPYVSTLFYFSGKTGIHESPDPGTKSVTFTVTPEVTGSIFPEVQMIEETDDAGGYLFYRGAIPAGVEIEYNKDVLFRGRFPVYQYGDVITVPANIFTPGDDY